MLNRFQFARLRGFRRGGKKGEDPARGRNDGIARDGRESNGRGASLDGDVAGGVRDSWADDDRVAKLLERRAAHQEEERRRALDRIGSTSGRTTPVDVAAPVPPAARTQDAPSARREADTRTTTVPAIPDGASRVDPGAHPLAGVPGDAPSQRAFTPNGRTSAGARVVCIASGKGGTGKSVMATNLAILRARRGERVLLVDFDAGLANAHLLLGLAPPYDVGHVMEGEVSAHQALVEGPHGLKLLAGGVGRQTMIDPTRRELDRLFKALRPLEQDFDLILIDHGAGLSYSTVAHLAATSTVILVTNHEVTALSDAYALYKRAHMVNPDLRVGMVINRSPDERIAMDAWERFRGAAHKFLGHTPEWIGWVPIDPAVPQAVQLRQPAVLSFPESEASRAFKRVAGWPPIDHARSATAFYDKARRALR